MEFYCACIACILTWMYQRAAAQLRVYNPDVAVYLLVLLVFEIQVTLAQPPGYFEGTWMYSLPGSPKETWRLAHFY